MKKQLIVFPGQRVICTDGKTHTVATQIDGQVFVFGGKCPGPFPFAVISLARHF